MHCMDSCKYGKAHSLISKKASIAHCIKALLGLAVVSAKLCVHAHSLIWTFQLHLTSRDADRLCAIATAKIISRCIFCKTTKMQSCCMHFVGD